MANQTPSVPPTALRRSRIRRFFRLLFWTVILVALLGGAAAAWVFYQDFTGDLPSIARLAHYAPPSVTRVYAGDGTTLLGEFYLQKRYPLPLDKIPLLVQHAFIAAEDKDFYKHRGVNFSAIVRALISNWNEGRTVQGGSTITQQIVKSILLTPEKSYRRKIQEMILALRLEQTLSKEEILELYLNQIYLGSGAYGVEAAAHEYFNKGVADLTLPEAAMIAGLAPAPSVYSPLKNLEGAKARQRYVLERMMEERYVSYAQAMTAWQEPISPLPALPASYTGLAPYYVEHVRQLLEKRYGEDAPEKLGLEVYTTVDLSLQKEAEKAFKEGIDILCRREGICRQGSANHLDGGLLAVDLISGQVKAMVGGYDFNRSQFNRATQSKRQPGSVFKPIVYAAALDHGYTPASIVKDSPVSYRSGGRRWAPKNSDHKFRGPIRVREALTFSRNVPTVRLADNIGIPYLLSYASSLGITTPLVPNLSVALGASEVTLLELIRAYGVFATGGTLFEPIFISRITDSRGALVNEASFKRTPVISPETAYLITSLLKSVVERGTGKAALELGRPSAGKTGTTDDYEDAWFIGYTPEMLTGVWVGFDEKRPLGSGETGGKVAAPIWTAFMKAALTDRPIEDFPMPEGITFAHINPVNGKRATAGGRAILELFARGTEPEVPVPVVSPLPPSPLGIEAPPPLPQEVKVSPPPLPNGVEHESSALDEEPPEEAAAAPLGETDLSPESDTIPESQADMDTNVGDSDVGASIGLPSDSEADRNEEPAEGGY